MLMLLGVLIVGSILILFYLLYLIVGILLISAVNKVSIKLIQSARPISNHFYSSQREHERMRLILFLMLIGVIVSFISIIGSVWAGLAGAILYSLVTCYFYICIYSLYVKLKDEGRGGQVHFQPAPYA